MTNLLPVGSYPPLLPPRKGQCLIIIATNLFEARNTTWIHNLYLRSNASRLPADSNFVEPFGMLAISHGELYLSSMTLQGQLTTQNATATKKDLNLLSLSTQPVSMGKGRLSGKCCLTSPEQLKIPAQVLVLGMLSLVAHSHSLTTSATLCISQESRCLP
jgi:hypothetical protein